MDAKEFYNQEMLNKPWKESCFFETTGITYDGEGTIEQEQLHSEDEMIAFAEAYHALYS